jgi:lathosterol oxidase
LLYSIGLIEHSMLYSNVSDYGWLWFWLSVPIMLLAHDAQFYWLHRLIHTRTLFSKIHRVHHLSKHPTAWAAYSFHPLEAIGEALIAISIIFVMPVHPLAFMLFQSISIVFNAYGHSGREFISGSCQQHWLGRWFNTSTAHNQHHRSAIGNYGLYFLFWDRWMGTERKPTSPDKHSFFVHEDA